MSNSRFKYLKNKNQRASALKYVKRGISFEKNSRLHEAEQCFEKAVLLDSKSGIAWNTLGFFYYENGKVDASLEAFGRALQLDEKNEVASKALDNILQVKLARKFLTMGGLVMMGALFVSNTIVPNLTRTQFLFNIVIGIGLLLWFHVSFALFSVKAIQKAKNKFRKESARVRLNRRKLIFSLLLGAFTITTIVVYNLSLAL